MKHFSLIRKFHFGRSLILKLEILALAQKSSFGSLHPQGKTHFCARKGTNFPPIPNSHISLPFSSDKNTLHRCVSVKCFNLSLYENE